MLASMPSRVAAVNAACTLATICPRTVPMLPGFFSTSLR